MPLSCSMKCIRRRRHVWLLKVLQMKQNWKWTAMAESFNWLRFRFPSVSGIPVFVTAFSPVLRLVQFLSSGHRSVIVKVKFSELEAGCLWPVSVTSLHNEKLYDLYASSDIIRVIKSRRLRCAGHVARMRECRSAYNVLVGKPEGGDHLENP